MKNQNSQEVNLELDDILNSMLNQIQILSKEKAFLTAENIGLKRLLEENIRQENE